MGRAEASLGKGFLDKILITKKTVIPKKNGGFFTEIIIISGTFECKTCSIAQAVYLIDFFKYYCLDGCPVPF